MALLPRPISFCSFLVHIAISIVCLVGTCLCDKSEPPNKIDGVFFERNPLRLSQGVAFHKDDLKPCISRTGKVSHRSNVKLSSHKVIPCNNLSNSFQTRRILSILRGGSDSSHKDLPTIQTILIPRKWSMPHMIRLVLIFAFTVYFSECLRSMGIPYQNAVRKLLSCSPSSSVTNTINPLDEYMAQLIAQGQNDILPPKYMPSAHSLLGGISIILIYVFGTILFPRWFLSFHVWLHYQRINSQTIKPNSIIEDKDDLRFVPDASNGFFILSESVHHNLYMSLGKGTFPRTWNQEGEDYFSSNLLQRRHHSLDQNKNCTGIALLIQSSTTHSTTLPSSSHHGPSSENVLWLYFSEDFDSSRGMKKTDTNVFSSHPLPYYFEWDQRRIYVDFIFEPQSEGQTRCTLKYKDGSPDFFQLLTIHELVEPCLRLLQSKTPHSTQSSFLPALSCHTLEVAKQRFGSYNNITLPTPSVASTFMSRISSPLSVLQVIGRLFTALEENFFPMMFNIGFVWFQHYLGAKQNVAAAKELLDEVQGDTKETAQMEVWALRPKRVLKKNGSRKTKTSWTKLHSSDLVPGDLFFLPLNIVLSQTRKESIQRQRELIMPVDALILDGSCVTREAVITGEAVAQSKVSIELCHSPSPSRYLDIDGIDRNSIIFAGTTVISTQISEPFSSMPKELFKIFKKTGCCAIPCLALRTGSSSSKGEIVRALAKSTTIVGAVTTHDIESDSLRLIFSLSCCALLACVSLFLPGLRTTTQTKSVSIFRRVIQCTRIATASIPSDLPLALASVVQTCSSSLRNEADVVCSDSAALIKAAQIDTVVWDKTGTLTEDTQALSLIVHPPWISQELEWNSSSRANNLGHTIPESMRDQFDKKYNKCHPLLHSVLVGCHSLRFECDENGSFNPVGDPLDIACLTDCPYDYYPDGVFTVQSNKSEAMDPLKMKKLWQIKTFPFDPNRRCSSSLALVLHHDNQFRLWALIKGSSEQLLNRFSHPPVNTNFTSTDFQGWYEGSSSTIGRLGMRTIALGVRNVSSDLRFFLRLFPDGLHTLQDDAQFNSKVKKARKWANENVERCMIEGFDSLLDNGKSSTEVVFDFVGICCFEAPLRRSTCRVVQELKKSGIRSIICTGDSVEAALAVANIVGISNQKNLAILNLRYDQDQPRLFWRLRDLGESESTIEISFRKFSFRKLSACKTIYPCLTGDAFLHLLDIHNHRIFTDEITFKLCSDLLLDVQRIVVLARASPSTKNLFVTSLRKVGSKVIFCGDGVNDVKALRESDLSVALLNGYSGLPSEKEDIEDDRRRERWHRKTMARLGTVLTATKMRLHLSMRESLDGSEPRQPTDILFAFCSAIQKELDRSRRLHEGGAKAAQILAKDDLLVKAHPSMATNRIKPDVTDSIKSGEACLASKFTCLRPCVDGIEFIIRYGIAASAFSLTLRRVTFLNCLMACFNLATLYRNGFRYGKYMWNIELFLAMALDKDIYRMSCSPRPRISTLRPSRSIFHLSSIIPIITQAVIHIFILSEGVNIFSSLSTSFSSSLRKNLTIKFPRVGELSVSSGKNTDPFQSFAPRERFHPNLSTNVVFVLSIYQTAIIALTNHLGSPYQENILECGSVVIWSALTILFCVILVTEELPGLNQVLELAPWPSKSAKLVMLGLLAIDGIGSVSIQHLSRMFRGYDDHLRNEVKAMQINRTAADDEVLTLADERKINKQIVWTLVALMTILIVKGFL